MLSGECRIILIKLNRVMHHPIISLSRRLRQTPYTNRVAASGVKGYTVYNHMLLPTYFRSVEEDYHHLKSAVQVWDVACERQVQVWGPDAARLVQILTPRDISSMSDDRCIYIPIVDSDGGMINDSVALKVEDERYWLSIADSDVLLWVAGLAHGMGLDVQICEPDVSPLAVQGPKSDTLMERVFGPKIHDIGFFQFKRLAFGETDFLVSRSGYSKQGGFEIYVEGEAWGLAVWDALFEGGKDLDVFAGCPNLIERIEGGLLSYGNDMTRKNSPFECGLGRFFYPRLSMDCIGGEALRIEAERGVSQIIRYLSIEGPNVPPCIKPWPVFLNGTKVGQVTSAAHSPDFKTNVAIGMIASDHCSEGTRLSVKTPTGLFDLEVHENPFIL